jgi:hypothetical protein
LGAEGTSVVPKSWIGLVPKVVFVYIMFNIE